MADACEPQPITDLAALEELYGTPAKPSLIKVARRMTPLYRRWIAASRLCILATVGPEGVDASPRGDDGPVVRELDPGRLALPDWRGNNRLDSLRNILRDPRASLLFLVPGSNNVVRVNGRALVTADVGLRQDFARDGKLPATVVVLEIAELYMQCARALVRSGTWSAGRTPPGGLPSMGQILAEMSGGAEGGAGYDAAWDARAAQTLW